MPLIKYLEKEENDLRKSLKINADISISDDEFNRIFEITLQEPKDIWVDPEESTEKIFYLFGSFLSEYQIPYQMVIATLFSENGPNFVLWYTLTQENSIADFYKKGERMGKKPLMNLSLEGKNEEKMGERIGGDKVEGSGGREWNMPLGQSGDGEISEVKRMDDLYLDTEEMELIEGKRSSFLGQLIQERSKKDIPFEEFHQYESYIQNTLEFPDEVYRFHENDGQIYFTYIKSYQIQNTSFFYIVICMHYQTNEMNGEETLIPILSFPSVDGDLYYKYKRGEKISGVLKC